MKYFIIFFLIIFIIIYNLYIIENKIENFENIYTINNVVDKVYVINLDKDIERMKNITFNLKKHNIDFTRVPAVYGREIYNNYNTTLSPGTLGCLLSNKNIIIDAKKNNYNKILVCEDDIILDKQFEKKFHIKYKYFMSKVKNYDLLYLGCSQTTNSNKIWNEMKVFKHFYIPKKSNGTFALIIDKSIYNDLLQLINKYEKPYDKIFVSNIQPFRKCYCLYPHIITANVNLVSNTDNKIRNMDNYLKNNKLNKDDFF